MSRLKQKLVLGMVRLADFKFHTNLPKWYGRIRKMSVWTPSEILEWQTGRMQKLVSEAYAHSAYYRELFDSLHLKPEDFKTLEDLERIPPLTKDIIRERFDDILLDNSNDYHYTPGSTGGSSGVPLKYIKDNNSWGFNNAFLVFMWNKTGYCYGDRFLALGSASLFPENKKSLIHRLYYGLKGKVPFNAMNVSDERLAQCVHLIKKKRIHYIYGYASSIYMLAKYVTRCGLQAELDINACFPTSEGLSEAYYDAIYKAFECQIVNSYGANDGGIMGFRFNKEKGFRMGYSSIVQTDSSGNALVTDLENTVFPFIRYELGDVVKPGSGYNSFHNGQVLEDVLGRKSDVIELENGHILTCPGFTILFKDLDIKGYRLVKKGPMKIQAELVRDEGFTKDQERLVIDTLKKHAGQDCEVEVVYSELLTRRENGKMFFYET